MRRVCIVQARMGSTRLPGKVLLDVSGRPMLAQQLRRLQACASLDEIVIATSRLPADHPIAALGSVEGVRVCRGSAEDVLSRFVQAARETGADVVVRVTADCPLIDPGVTDQVIDDLTSHADVADYVSNVEHRTFPRGLDVEAFFIDTLGRVDRLARTDAEREHVTLTIRANRPSIFLTRSVENWHDDSDLRWTVDEEPDLALVRRIYEELGLGDKIVPYAVILDHARRHPELVAVNAGVATWTPDPVESVPVPRQDGARGAAE